MFPSFPFLAFIFISKIVQGNVHLYKDSVEINPSTHHDEITKRDTYLNTISLDIDKSNSIFNTYLRDIPIVYSQLQNSDNQIVLLSVTDYEIHRLNYKVWQLPNKVDSDMSDFEKEITIKENIVSFINDYLFNLKNSDPNLDLKAFISWIENSNPAKKQYILKNENGKPVIFQRDKDNRLILDNGFQTLNVDIDYIVYENGIVFVLNGCFDKRMWY